MKANAKDQMEVRIAEARSYMEAIEARFENLEEKLEADVNWCHTGDAAHIAEELKDLARFAASGMIGVAN